MKFSLFAPDFKKIILSVFFSQWSYMTSLSFFSRNGGDEGGSQQYHREWLSSGKSGKVREFLFLKKVATLMKILAYIETCNVWVVQEFTGTEKNSTST